MDSRLYSAGYLAIPLKANEGHPLNPQPNFMVIENIFGKLTAILPVLGETLCKQSAYKLVFREILLANEELGRTEQLNEIVFENTNQPIPITISGAFDTYENLKTYLNEVNQLLGLFQFRGVLSGFQLIIDEDILDSILAPELITTTENITTTTENITTTVMETTTLEVITTTLEEVTTTENIITTTEPITTTQL